MKLETAIISNEHLLQDPAINLSENEAKSIRLGNAALKAYLAFRLEDGIFSYPLLPGETKE